MGESKKCVKKIGQKILTMMIKNPIEMVFGVILDNKKIT